MDQENKTNMATTLELIEKAERFVGHSDGLLSMNLSLIAIARCLYERNLLDRLIEKLEMREAMKDE